MSEARSIAARLAAVRARIADACRRAGRDPGSVRLIAVSKRHPTEAIREAYAAGQRAFGENYVQELCAKADELRDLDELELRFIGHLQRNKVKQVVAARCSVDCVDSLSLANALSARAASAGGDVEVLIQVNVDAEDQKAGVAVQDVAELAAALRALPHLRLVGLMAIPREHEDPRDMRPAFRRLRELGQELGLAELSMGMSADLEVAVEEGATMVRVGTAIFGPRAG